MQAYLGILFILSMAELGYTEYSNFKTDFI